MVVHCPSLLPVATDQQSQGQKQKINNIRKTIAMLVEQSNSLIFISMPLFFILITDHYIKCIALGQYYGTSGAECSISTSLVFDMMGALISQSNEI